MNPKSVFTQEAELFFGLCKRHILSSFNMRFLLVNSDRTQHLHVKINKSLLSDNKQCTLLISEKESEDIFYFTCNFSSANVADSALS